MKDIKTVVAACIASLCVAQAAEAALLTSDPGTGTTTVFTVTGNQGFDNPGPVVLDGITWTGNPQVTYGDACYGLVANGSWSCGSSFSWVATNNGTGSITAALGGGFGFVGGFMNYAPGFGNNATIEALAADGTTVLESYDLVALASISTPGGSNAGAFRGIERTQDDIHFFRLSGDFIITHTLQVGNVPEPGTLALLGLGLAGLAASRRRKQ